MATGRLILDPYVHAPRFPPPARYCQKPSGWGLPIVPNIDDWREGDIVLVAGAGLTGILINGGQRVFAPGTATGAIWSHAGIYIGNGQIVEAAAGSGIKVGRVEGYCIKRALAVVRLQPAAGLPANFGALAAQFAMQRIGNKYAWQDLVALLKVWQTPAPQAPSSAGNSAYCSALVVQCYAKSPINTPLDTAVGCLPCLPSTLACHPWLDDVPLEWCS